MKTNMKSSIRKILTLTLAFLCLATLLSIMPEHSRAHLATHSSSATSPALAQK